MSTTFSLLPGRISGIGDPQRRLSPSEIRPSFERTTQTIHLADAAAAGHRFERERLGEGFLGSIPASG
jgi:hypothetical protein